MEESFLIGALSPGRPFLVALSAVLVVAVVVRAIFRVRAEERYVAVTGAVERWMLTVIIFGLVLLSSFQIVYRNVFGSGFVWIDPLLRSLVLWLAFLGAFAATAKGRHIAIDVFGRILPPTPRKILVRVLSFLSAAICVAMANGAYEYLTYEKEFAQDAFLGLQTWHVQSILLIGFALLAYRFLVAAFVVQPPTQEGGSHSGERSDDGGAASSAKDSATAAPGPADAAQRSVLAANESAPVAQKSTPMAEGSA